MALIKSCKKSGGVEIVPFTPTGQDYDNYVAGTNFEIGHTYIFGAIDQTSATVYDVTSGGTKIIAIQKADVGVGTGGCLIFTATSNTVVTNTRQWSPFYEIIGDVNVSS